MNLFAHNPDYNMSSMDDDYRNPISHGFGIPGFTVP